MEETKWCFVPTCLNSTKNTVNKWFVPIPVNAKRREIWFKAVNRNYCPDSARSTLYCCSDHFNLSEDAGDFFERNGEVVVKLKKSIVPRLSKSASEGLTPLMNQKESENSPVKRIRLTSKPQLSSSSSHEIVTIDGNSSSDDDNVDVVGVVSSNPSNPRKALMNQRLMEARQSLAKSSSAKTPKTSKKSKQVVALVSPTPPSQQAEPCTQPLKSLFDYLRKSIPAITSQQVLTREQILDEAVEFIIQMRNKSDKRRGTMHYVMENNSSLTAKIQHLENLIALHEKNEIVLTKEVVDRRLGAVAAPRPASLSLKPPKQKAKRI